MILDYKGLNQINGSLVILEGVENASYEEMVSLRLDDGTERAGRIVKIDGNRVVIQVFEGTRGLSMVNTRTRLTGKPMEMALSPEIIGRTFDGLGRPIDGMGEIYPVVKRNVNGSAINPVARVYPRNCILTGISSIDALATLIRGQKLPIFSGSGMKHTSLPSRLLSRHPYPTTPSLRLCCRNGR
jgi:V/A-type H+-transporting ATPase subunit B